MSKLKLFINEHYNGILLGIITISLAASFLLLALIVISSNEQVKRSNEQLEILRGLSQEISQGQQQQHNYQDERQACFFNLFVSYVNTHSPITKAQADECRVITTDQPEAMPEPQPVSQSPRVPVSSDKPEQEDSQPQEDRQGFIPEVINDIGEGVQSFITGIGYLVEELTGR